MKALLDKVIELIFGKKTVDFILAEFHKAIAALEKVEQKALESATEARDEIKKLADEVDGHTTEAARAAAVRAKLSDLVK